MQLLRKAKLSIRYLVADLFRNPRPDSGFSRAFNVYGEQEARQASDPRLNWSGTRPYIFLLDNQVRFTPVMRPAIVIRAGPTSKDFWEVGNQKLARKFTFAIHIFGRNRGESEDFADYISNHLVAIPIYDWDLGGNPPPLLETAQLADEILITTEESLEEEKSIEGTVAHQIDILFVIQSFLA